MKVTVLWPKPIRPCAALLPTGSAHKRGHEWHCAAVLSTQAADTPCLARHHGCHPTTMSCYQSRSCTEPRTCRALVLEHLPSKHAARASVGSSCLLSCHPGGMPHVRTSECDDHMLVIGNAYCACPPRVGMSLHVAGFVAASQGSAQTDCILSIHSALPMAHPGMWSCMWRMRQVCREHCPHQDNVFLLVVQVGGGGRHAGGEGTVQVDPGHPLLARGVAAW
jgi:hypothetical protein